MLNLQEDIQYIIINSYLDMKDKIKLSLISKYFNKKININYHVGSLIKNHLGLNELDKEDLKILRENKIEMIKEISDFLLNDNIRKKKCKQISYFPFSYTVKVKNLNYEESKNFIEKKNIRIKRKNYVSYSYFSKHFPYSNALLLCKNLV